MRAVVFSDFGSALEFRDDVAVQEPNEDEVRVRVHSASVNGFDLAVTKGTFKGMFEHRFPVVLGKDFAGVVDAVGSGTEGYVVGDRVFGVVTKHFLGDGSFGEYVTVPTAVGLAKLPDSLSFADGAALGLAGTAATDAVDALQLRPGQSLLIVGATGGVGGYAVQLGVQAGATVIATAHTEEEKQLVASLGAAEVVDYTGDVAAQVRTTHPDGVDAAIHLAGDLHGLLPALRAGGRLASTLIMSPDQVPAGSATVAAVYANPSGATLERLAAGCAEQRTRVVVDSVYPLADMADAFAHFAGGTLGKVIISID